MKVTVVAIILSITGVITLTSPACMASSVERPAATSPQSLTNNSVQTVLSTFKNLPVQKKKERVREARQLLKQMAKGKNQPFGVSDRQLLLIVLSILLPPLAVYLHQGEFNNKFLISLLLTLLFWLPGIVYSLLVVLDEI